MGWFKFDEAGNCTGHGNVAPKPGATGIWWENDGSVPWPGTDTALIQAQIEDGAVTSVTVNTPPELYAHLTLSGGAMGNSTYAIPQGSALTATLKITATDDPAAAAIVGLTNSWPIVVRNKDTNKGYNKLIAVTDGEGSTTWTPPANSDYEVRESEFRKVPRGAVEYTVRLRGYYDDGGLVLFATGNVGIYAYEA